jgi:hypothetical protein
MPGALDWVRAATSATSNLTGAYPLLMESKAGSKFLFYRASLSENRSHFSGRTPA